MGLPSKLYLNKGVTMAGGEAVRKNSNSFGAKTWKFQDELNLQKGQKKKQSSAYDYF